MLPAVFFVQITAKLDVTKKITSNFDEIFMAKTAGNTAVTSFYRKFNLFLIFFSVFSLK